MNNDNLNNFFKGRKVIVTGAAGHLGSQLTLRLIAAGAKVIALVRSTADLGRLEGHRRNFEAVQEDIRELDSVALAERLGSVDTIFHLAAAGVNPSDNDPMVLIETNVTGTLNALELARLLKVRRFVYCGSCFEYGALENALESVSPAPVSEYGASKAMGWILANTYHRKHKLPVVSLRPFTLYGPGQGAHRLIAHVINCVNDKKPIELTSGDQKRDFIYIDDAVEAFLLAAVVKGIEGETINVGSGNAVSIKEIVALILKLMSSKVVAKWGSLPRRKDEIAVISGNPRQAEELLDWKATTSLEEGLRKTIDYHVK